MHTRTQPRYSSVRYDHLEFRQSSYSKGTLSYILYDLNIDTGADIDNHDGGQGTSNPPE